MRPEGSGSMSPLLVSHSLSQDGSLPPGGVSLGGGLTQLPQAHKPRLLLQRPQPLPQEAAASYHDALEPSWAESVPPVTVCSGSWLQVPSASAEFPHHRPCSRSSSSSGSQKLKNKTKNLWNPTYGSWVLESIGRAKTALSHTQSVPLSCSSTSSSAAPAAAIASSSTSERNDSEAAGGCQSSAGVLVSTAVSSAPGSSQTPAGAQGLNSGLSSRKGPMGGGAAGGGGATSGSPASAMDLAKLQTFPCGNVNYAYDEQSYEVESLPLVVPKAAEPIATSTSTVITAARSSSLGISLAGLALALPSTSGHKPMVKRHASYGHEDIKRHAKPEKPTRDRDSGFSLSEDLSVTPV